MIIASLCFPAQVWANLEPGEISPNNVDTFQFVVQPAAAPTGLTLSWQTACEMEIIGFNIWRQSEGETVFTRLTENMIEAAQPGSITGNEYSWADAHVDQTARIYYQLQVVQANNTSAYLFYTYQPAPTESPLPQLNFRVMLPLVTH